MINKKAFPHSIMNKATRASLLAAVCLCLAVGAPGDSGRSSFASDHRSAGRAGQDSSPDNRGANAYQQARLLIADKQWAKAADMFKEAIALDGDARYVDAALYYLAFALKKQNMLKDADVALERIVREFPNSSWSDDARAMRLEIAPELGKVDNLAQESRSAQSEEVRLAALQSLFATDPQQAKEIVLDILRPGSNASRRLKVGVITLFGQSEEEDGRITSRLTDIIRNESDAEIRKAAIHALWRNGEESVLSLLKDTAVRSDDPELSEAALTVIARRISDHTRELLTEIATTATSMQVRKSAISRLSIRAGADTIDQLMRIFDATPDVEGKQYILSIVARTITPQAISKIVKIAREDNSEELRKHAVILIGKLNDYESIELLSGLYDTESSDGVKRAILFALAKSDKREALVKVMRVARSDSSPELRREARSQLERSNDPEVRRFLEGLPRER